MTVSPTSVPASSTSTLAFTYTPVADRTVAEVRLDVPDGWTAPAQEPPPASATDPGAVSVTCPDASGCRVLSVKGWQITVVAAGGHGTEPKFTIFYSNATAPGSATTSTFAASELSGSNEQFMP